MKRVREGGLTGLELGDALDAEAGCVEPGVAGVALHPFPLLKAAELSRVRSLCAGLASPCSTIARIQRFASLVSPPVGTISVLSPPAALRRMSHRVLSQSGFSGPSRPSGRSPATSSRDPFVTPQSGHSRRNRRIHPPSRPQPPKRHRRRTPSPPLASRPPPGHPPPPPSRPPPPLPPGG